MYIVIHAGRVVAKPGSYDEVNQYMEDKITYVRNKLGKDWGYSIKTPTYLRMVDLTERNLDCIWSAVKMNSPELWHAITIERPDEITVVKNTK